MARVKVFLVDDHSLVREGIRRLLEMDERISVVDETGSGEEALERVGACPADLVLMDILLPGIDGIETTRQLRAKYPDLKVIVLTSIGDQYLAEAIEAGANGYMLKTATQPELLQAVVQVADGQDFLDPTLTARLFDRLVELSHSAKRQALSSRQREILRLVADGVSSKEISVKLSVSAATLTRELRHIFDLLGVNDRTHAVAEAYRRNLL